MITKNQGDVIGYIKKTASASFLIKIVGLFLGFVSQVVFARLLGADVFGAYIFLMSSSLFVINISNLGLNKTALKVIPEFQSRRVAWQSTFEKFSVMTTLTVSFVVIIIAGIFFEFVSRKTMPSITMYSILLFGALSIVSAILTLYTGFLQADRKPIMGQFPEQIVRPILILLGITCFWFFLDKLKLEHILAVTLLAGICVVFWIVYQWRLAVKNIDYKDQSIVTREEKRHWISIGLGFQAVTISNALLTQTDILMIGGLLGEKSVALYGVAMKVASLLGFFHVSANMVIAPIISRNYIEGDKLALQKMVTYTAQLIAGFTFLATIILIVISPWILSFFGKSYVEAKYLMYVLCIGFCVEAIAGPVSYLMSFAGMQKILIKILFGCALLNLVLNPLFISLWGIMGSAIATAIVILACNVIMVIVAYKFIGINATCIKWPLFGRSK